MTERTKLTLKKSELSSQATPDKAENKQPPPKKTTYKDVIKTVYWLGQQYPELFNYQEPTKPLKIKILNDLAQAHPKQSKKQFGRALNLYTSTWQYHELIIRSTHRYDLDGEMNGVVTESSQVYSKEALAEKLAKKERRALAKQQKAGQEKTETSAET